MDSRVSGEKAVSDDTALMVNEGEGGYRRRDGDGFVLFMCAHSRHEVAMMKPHVADPKGRTSIHPLDGIL